MDRRATLTRSSRRFGPTWPAVLAGVLLAAWPIAGSQADPQRWPTAGWAISTPGAERLDPEPFAALDRRVRAGEFGNVDRVLVVRHGRVVVDERYARDYREISRGRVGPIGCGEGCADPAAIHEFNYFHPDFHPYYQGRDVHSLQSVTKSVTSALVGIAIGRGEIAGTTAPLLSFFGDYDLSRVDARLRAATLDDLLTMRTGIEWHEGDRPLDDTNTTIQLERSDDWIRFTLDQPMDAAPGEKWVYNSGGSHLMSGVIRAATGRHVDVFAREHLFGPLGIDDFHWKKTPRGYPDTEGGLYLEAADLAKIGYLYLRDGLWEGRRILPDGWVAASTTRHVESTGSGPWGYGYQWWLTDRAGVAVWAARGFGGQFLVVVPEHDVIGVSNAWNVFGDRVPAFLGPLLDAMFAAVRE